MQLRNASDNNNLGFEDGLISIIQFTFNSFGQCYNQSMQIINFPEMGNNKIGASGICPHCAAKSYFQPVGGPNIEETPNTPEARICNAAKCEACKEYILVIGKRPARYQPPPAWALVATYPIGKPNEAVDEAVPENIAADFREALRCHWIKAFRATVAMCRRAIQASALEKGASPRKKLTEQIDELASNGIVTTPLKEMAHEIRLTGNVGAHPDEDDLRDVIEKDADDIIEFTEEFFHHVYVMPQKLAVRRKKPTTGP